MRYKYKIPHGVRIMVECALCQYPTVSREISTIESDMIPSATQILSHTPVSGGGGESRPVEDVSMRIMRDNRLYYLKLIERVVWGYLDELCRAFMGYIDASVPLGDDTIRYPLAADAPMSARAAYDTSYLLLHCYINGSMPIDTAAVLIGASSSRCYALLNVAYYTIACRMGWMRYQEAA